MKTTHVIFDLDGTLIDSSAGVVEAVNYAFSQLGETPPSAESIRASIGFPLEEFFRQVSDLPVPELYRHFQVRAAESVVGAAVPLAGVQETLDALGARGYCLGIATTKINAHINRILRKLNWEKYFKARVGADDVRNVKPDPEAFLLAMTRLGARPASTLVVGDTVNDVVAAQAIPVRVAAVDSPYGGADRVRALSPDYVIARLPELIEILENGNSKVRAAHDTTVSECL